MAVTAINIWKDNEVKNGYATIIEFPHKEKKSGNKKKGRKSEVYPFQIEDTKKIIDYFEKNEMWLHYLLFVLGINMARRVGDTLNLRWENFYNPHTGKMREDILEIVEDKTDKLANPRINSACRNAIEKYIEKTGACPEKNGYHEYVFMQLSGTHKGTVITSDGYRKALKKAAEAVGITYNVGTHSTRKTFGMISRMIHPNDYDSMELLQTIYNHSDTKTTKHYIGLTREKVNQYYDDMGVFFDDYVTGNKEYKDVSNKPVISIEASDLRDIIAMAYSEGQRNANVTEASVHIDTINEIMGLIDSLAK